MRTKTKFEHLLDEVIPPPVGDYVLRPDDQVRVLCVDEDGNSYSVIGTFEAIVISDDGEGPSYLEVATSEGVEQVPTFDVFGIVVK